MSDENPEDWLDEEYKHTLVEAPTLDVDDVSNQAQYSYDEIYPQKHGHPLRYIQKLQNALFQIRLQVLNEQKETQKAHTKEIKQIEANFELKWSAHHKICSNVSDSSSSSSSSSEVIKNDATVVKELKAQLTERESKIEELTSSLIASQALTKQWEQKFQKTCQTLRIYELKDLQERDKKAGNSSKSLFERSEIQVKWELEKDEITHKQKQVDLLNKLLTRLVIKKAPLALSFKKFKDYTISLKFAAKTEMQREQVEKHKEAHHHAQKKSVFLAAALQVSP